MTIFSADIVPHPRALHNKKAPGYRYRRRIHILSKEGINMSYPYEVQ